MSLSLEEKINMLPSLRATVEAHGLLAKKALGQNFLLDRNITGKIIRLSLNAQNLSDYRGAAVYEVGPGPGGLTREILRAEPDKLTVVEMDERCIAIMEEIKTKVGERLQIVNGDALKQNFAELNQTPCHIVSNLPYNISVPLLVGWLKEIENFASLTLMFQKEVADRILAPVGSKDYGRISILSQLLCKIEKLFDLNPECFVPAPKIWSSVLLFTPLRSGLSAKDIAGIEKLSALAFGQRRKMIRQSLKSIPGLEKICCELQIPLTSRAEQITPNQFLALARRL
ncbi:MAG: 16S rRNA (adenine(1518)-N(6)/adenine(1519)-N(6))-dimethyltransferase RsmA [Alphaproteobacteria bacterium]|jgi:16S rRNA (adenine1518-N6/adenine1519-N6)-dimethyltransferase|nr:16S rRNA (adenine(1518)-N(6)/adenine(1519)-N(6))-dimethyltransferase RsmA [Alphaproteobacteria bacterium]MBP3418475.1 16S rRNA (adenine(1518)-N(6)/adenine(1519)-N(6))-dimethyltransferase RsmA [Alphaproteobacteria bacterium]